jgi:ribosome-associated translation inhibitor RaiA
MQRRAPFAGTVPKTKKARAGRTDTSSTPLAIRGGVRLAPATREAVRLRLGRKLGKFALQIERVSVRFEDVNGPRGGVDTACRIKVVVSGLPSIVVEERAADARLAFAQAAPVVERAVRRVLGRAGYTVPRRSRRRPATEAE